MTVHTVVLNHESTADTLACLDAVRQSTWRDQFIVVVDNASSAAERKTLEDALPTTRLILSERNLGYAGGNNLAIREAQCLGADFVWLLNPDTRVEPHTLERLVSAAQARPDIGLLGPRILQRDGRIASDGGRVDPVGRVLHENAGREPETVGDSMREVDFVTGSCMLIRRSTVDDIGPLPEDYFLYFEETDFAMRAARAGWTSAVIPSATAVHGRTSATRLPTPSYLYYYTRGHMLFLRRWFDEDTANAVALLDEFVFGWRRRVAADAPSWLDAFEHLVARGIEDGAAGRTGASDVPGQVDAP